MTLGSKCIFSGCKVKRNWNHSSWVRWLRVHKSERLVKKNDQLPAMFFLGRQNHVVSKATNGSLTRQRFGQILSQPINVGQWSLVNSDSTGVLNGPAIMHNLKSWVHVIGLCCRTFAPDCRNCCINRSLGRSHTRGWATWLQPFRWWWLGKVKDLWIQEWGCHPPPTFSKKGRAISGFASSRKEKNKRWRWRFSSASNDDEPKNRCDLLELLLRCWMFLYVLPVTQRLGSLILPKARDLVVDSMFLFFF